MTTAITKGSHVEIIDAAGLIVDPSRQVVRVSARMVVLDDGSKWSASDGTPWGTAYYQGHRWAKIQPRNPGR